MKLLHSVLFIFLLLSIWVLLSLELPLIPKIEVPFTDEVITGLNNVFVGLSYSYIVGILVYYFTVIIPDIRERKRLRPLIITHIETVGKGLSLCMWGFPPLEETESHDSDIKNIRECEAILKTADWNSINPIPRNLNLKDKSFKTTFYYDYCAVQSRVHVLLDLYMKYLDIEQISMLEKIQNPEFMMYLDVLRNTVFPEHGQDFIVDGFMNVLETYDMLVSYRSY